jgi:hypothetical protein
MMAFIGDVRRRLFIEEPHEWNGIVRDITARCETGEMRVDPDLVATKLNEFYRGRASLALMQMRFFKLYREG